MHEPRGHSEFDGSPRGSHVSLTQCKHQALSYSELLQSPRGNCVIHTAYSCWYCNPQALGVNANSDGFHLRSHCIHTDALQCKLQVQTSNPSGKCKLNLITDALVCVKYSI